MGVISLESHCLLTPARLILFLGLSTNPELAYNTSLTTSRLSGAALIAQVNSVFDVDAFFTLGCGIGFLRAQMMLGASRLIIGPALNSFNFGSRAWYGGLCSRLALYYPNRGSSCV